MQNIKDFFQGASNSIASNVSAPVDGIAWLLRKAGVPVPPNPMGGSDWMNERGLTPQPQNRTAGLLGEAFGLSGPMVAGAKAAQVARGLLSLDDKAMDMGRVALENQMVKSGMIQPATVWHGSPHKFDKFDSAKIGTGDGHASYGQGLYFAESDEVAKEYSRLSKNVVEKSTSFPTVDGKRVTGTYNRMVADDIAKTYRGNAKNALDDAVATGADKEYIAAAQNFVGRDLSTFDRVKYKSGNMYKVDIPDEQIAKMLDWDKPLSGQSAEVQAAVRNIRPGIDNLGSPDWNGKMQKTINQSGEDFIEWMGRGHADRLMRQGIPGIRHLEGGATGGTSNYVVFPGNEGLLNILERNGKSIR